MGSKMTKEKLVELINKIMNAEYEDQEEGNKLINLLEKNILDPNVSDLIFYPQTEMTAEEIVEKALAYKPIRL